jgi:hypothetical protein
MVCTLHQILLYDRIKENDLSGACSTHGEINVYNILVGKSDWKRPLGRPRCRWEDNIKMDLREIRLEGVYWIHLA